MSNGDPVITGKRHIGSFEKRMGRYDGSYTPTEQRIKDGLMKQFCSLESSTNSEAYTSAPCWCEKCGRLRDSEEMRCSRCVR